MPDTTHIRHRSVWLLGMYAVKRGSLGITWPQGHSFAVGARTLSFGSEEPYPPWLHQPNGHGMGSNRWSAFERLCNWSGLGTHDFQWFSATIWDKPIADLLQALAGQSCMSMSFVFIQSWESTRRTNAVMRRRHNWSWSNRRYRP